MEFGLAGNAKAVPDRTALVLGNQRQSYGELNRRVNRLANGLTKVGVGPEDKIAVLLKNSFEFFEVANAATKLGAVAVPVNYHFKAAEIEYIVNDSDSIVFVYDAEFLKSDVLDPILDKLPKVKLQLCVGDPPRKATDYEKFLAAHSDAEPDVGERTAMPATMVYTSGTTGRPKGVYRKPRDLGQAAQLFMGFLQMFNLAPGDVHLLVGPLYHAAPSMFANLHIALGGTVVILQKFDPEEALRLIERERVTTSHMVPTMFVRILNLPADVRRRYDLSSLKSVVHAAAPCPVDVKWRIMELFGQDTIYEYYAATEVGGTYISPEEWRRKPGSVGRPFPGATVKIFDDEENECRPGQIGTIYMRLEGMSDFQYYKDDDKTRSARRENMVTVGDMGYFDEDGYLFIADRKIDMVISGGVNIYPKEIEEVLITHPKILDVAVIGVPDPEWGEQLKAIVQLKPGETASSEEIIRFASERLAGYKRPRSVDFMDELPRELTGKLLKRKLRERYWAGSDRRV